MKAIPGAIPAIRADELLASYWRRLLDLNGIGQSRYFAAQTIGGPWRQLAIALPLHLDKFWETCGHWLDLSVNQGIEQHTLFPVFACGLPDIRRDHLRLRMQKGGLGPRRPALPLLLAEHLPYAVSICEQCAKEDEAALGFSYWHREHNCPGVYFCPTHSKLLTQFSTKEGHHSSLAIGDAKCGETENDRRLHSAYGELLQLTGDGLASFRANLQQRALQLCDSTCAKRIDIPRVAELLCDNFVHGFATDSLSHLVWNERAVRDAVGNTFASRPTVHPLWVALLHSSLPLLCSEPKKMPPCKKKRNDEQTLLPALLAARSLTHASRSLGVSVTTLATVARRNEISFSARPSKVNLGMRAAIESALLAGEAIPAIAARFGLGVGSVYRALASQPEIARERKARAQARAIKAHRSSWRRLLSEHGRITSSDARRKAPALWAWLYRNDRHWLQRSTYSAPSRKVRQATRRPRTRINDADRKRLSTVLADVHDSRKTEGLDPRLTRTRVAHSIGSHGAAQMERCLADVYSAPIGEPIVDYVQRRLWSAKDAILESTMALRGWRLLRTARLRNQTIVAANVDLDSYIGQIVHGGITAEGGSSVGYRK